MPKTYTKIEENTVYKFYRNPYGEFVWFWKAEIAEGELKIELVLDEITRAFPRYAGDAAGNGTLSYLGRTRMGWTHISVRLSGWIPENGRGEDLAVAMKAIAEEATAEMVAKTINEAIDQVKA